MSCQWKRRKKGREESEKTKSFGIARKRGTFQGSVGIGGGKGKGKERGKVKGRPHKDKGKEGASP